MAKKQQQSNKMKWGIILAVILFLLFISYAIAGIFYLILNMDDSSTSRPSARLGSSQVALIPVEGVILTQSSQDLFSEGVADSSTLVQDIEDAAQDPTIKAIIFEINSPGGAPVASDEIAQAIKRVDKPTVAWIREIGTSGAYWIASSTDHIIANRMSLTGSIGVIGSYLDFSGFINDWNVSYERLVAGRYKDSGTPLRALSDQERKLIQKKIDLLHQEFKDEVQRNRGFTNSEIAAVSEGEFYLGSEAISLGLVDELGSKYEVEQHLQNVLNVSSISITTYEHIPSFLDILGSISSTPPLIESSLSSSRNIGMVR